MTLSDVVRYFENSCCSLPMTHDQLLLRYELQEDHSLLGKDEFEYDHDPVKVQIKLFLEFWLGNREASYPPMEELWKCKFCKFASVCPINSDPDDSPSKTKSEGIPSPDLTPKVSHSSYSASQRKGAVGFIEFARFLLGLLLLISPIWRIYYVV